MAKQNSSRHARQVSINRVNKAGQDGDKSARKAVAVRVRGDSSTEQVLPTAPKAEERAAQAVSQPVAENTEIKITQDIAEPESSPAKEKVAEETDPAEISPDSASHTPPEKPETVSQPAVHAAEPTPEPEKEEVSRKQDSDDPAPDEPALTEEPEQPSEQLDTILKETVSPETTSSETASQKPAKQPDIIPAPVLTAEKMSPDGEGKISQSGEKAPQPVSTPESTVSAAAQTEQRSGEEKKWYIPQKWEEITLPRKIIMILSVALFLFSHLPLTVGILCPGIVPPAMIAMFFFGCALYWPQISGCESTAGNVIIAVVAVCVLAGVSYLSFVSGKMISASAHTLREDTSQVTVVVLGCRVKGDRPSLMLTARLEKAAEFLLAHPQAHCIVTGGQGPDEDYPEAQVMKNYLVEKGVSPMRIIMESTSTNTVENITNAADLARRYNCHDRFLIVTDRFHQYRAMSIANDLGMVSYALNVETAWYLVMPYWFREMAAITRDWVVA